MTYDYFCKYCGFHFQHADRLVVKAVRDGHRAGKSKTTETREGIVLNGNHSCGLVRMLDGTSARPAIAAQVSK